MSGRKALLLLPLLTAACGPPAGRGTPCADGASAPAGVDYLARGTLVHLRGKPYTYDDDFRFTADTHAVVEVYSYEGEDSSSTTVARQCLAGVAALPLSFRVPGDLSIFAARLQFGLAAYVYSGPWDDLRVGDLLSEYRIEVSAANRDLTVQLTGIEECGTPQAGGFCTSRRPP